MYINKKAGRPMAQLATTHSDATDDFRYKITDDMSDGTDEISTDIRDACSRMLCFPTVKLHKPGY